MSRVLHTFRGGVQVPRFKHLTKSQPARPVPFPPRLVFPLRAHIGMPSRPVVGVGERVLKGQVIATPDGYVSQALHASTSGTVIALGDEPVAHPAGLSAPCIVIEADGADRAVDPWPAIDYGAADPAELQRRIVEAGIIGMGGAGFPAHVKVREGVSRTVETLIINGVECEPYITCDDRLIRERPGQVVAGARILKAAVRAHGCVIALEDDMPEAAAALAPHLGSDIELVRVPAIYPAGGEKQLIKVITGREVPSKGLPIQAGVLMHNVATAAAVYQAVVGGLPLLSRYVTVAGDLRQPGNLEARLGTPIAALLDHCGRPDAALRRLIMGGPMMGIGLRSEQVPVTKTSNCVLVFTTPVPGAAEMPCIRCGECVQVCPVQLHPQALYEFACARDLDSAQDYNLFDCIECGACAYVCPSHIPLVQYYRYAKAEVEALDRTRATFAGNRARHEARHNRTAAADAVGPAGTAVVEAAATQAAPEERAALQAEIRAAVERNRRRRERRRRGGDADGGDESPP